MKYELKIIKEKIGHLEIEIETIKDLDAAIDTLCHGVDEKSAESVFLADLCPYFGVLWPSARALALHLERMGTWIKGKKIIEIGCGLALPSIVAAKNGAIVITTDFHPEVPIFLERNQKLNNVLLQYKKVDWNTSWDEKNLIDLENQFDFVIASDVLYENGQAKNLANTFSKLSKKNGHIILTDPGRPYLQEFERELTLLGFRVDLLSIDEIFLISATTR